MRTLAHHLFGQTRSRVLSALLLRPDSAWHVRELARMTGASPGSLHRELRLLAGLGLLTREEVGRQVHYRADRDSPVFHELAGVLRKTAGLADVLREALQPLWERIAVAFVYGSMASGKERARSDVDVMVLGDVDFTSLIQALATTQETLGREVNVTPLRPDALATMLRRSDGFAVNVMKAPKIFLKGNDHELAELTEDRARQGARGDTGGNTAATGRRRAKPG